MNSGKGGSPYGYTNPKASHTYEMIQQCRTERANGSSLKQICRKHSLPINTLRGWLYTSRRAHPDHITEIK